MDFGWWMGLIGFAFALAATPGPNNTMVTASGATHGMARTLPLMAGIAIGVAAIMLTVTAFGSSVVVQPHVGAVLKWIGVAYLLWLAWTIAAAKTELTGPDAKALNGTAPISFTHGALIQLVNPKLWIMVGGAVVTYGQASGDTNQLQLAVLFAFVFGAMTFASTVAWAAIGASIGRLLVSRQAIRSFNIAMAILLMTSLVPIIME